MYIKQFELFFNVGLRDYKIEDLLGDNYTEPMGNLIII